MRAVEVRAVAIKLFPSNDKEDGDIPSFCRVKLDQGVGYWLQIVKGSIPFSMLAKGKFARDPKKGLCLPGQEVRMLTAGPDVYHLSLNRPIPLEISQWLYIKEKLSSPPSSNEATTPPSSRKRKESTDEQEVGKPDVARVVYVLENLRRAYIREAIGPDNLKAGKYLYSIPVGLPYNHMESYFLQKFADISGETLMELLVHRTDINQTKCEIREKEKGWDWERRRRKNRSDAQSQMRIPRKDGNQANST